MSTLFSRNIRFAALIKSISLNQMAAALGISVQKAASFIKGSSVPDVFTAEKMAELFGFPLQRLIYDDLGKIQKKIQNFGFRFLVMDIDGVLTDGSIFYTEAGDEIKRFNAKDGLGILSLTAKGIRVGFISSGPNDRIIEKRAEKLGVQHISTGNWKKNETLGQWVKELKIEYNNVAYIGDDVNDLPAMQLAGLSVCPADAVQEVKNKADIILSLPGGKGCVREFIDLYLI